MYDSTTPAPRVLPCFFALISAPFSRRSASAFVSSPPASSSAFLHCITEMPVLSRSALICSVVIIEMLPQKKHGCGGWCPTQERMLPFLSQAPRRPPQPRSPHSSRPPLLSPSRDAPAYQILLYTLPSLVS